MSESTTTFPTSIRLSAVTRQNLEEASKLTKRSLSFLVEQTLKNHLESVIKNESKPSPKQRIERLKLLQGSVASQSIEVIDQSIRQMRGDNE